MLWVGDFLRRRLMGSDETDGEGETARLSSEEEVEVEGDAGRVEGGMFGLGTVGERPRWRRAE
jgi:hypothetical protein